MFEEARRGTGVGVAAGVVCGMLGGREVGDEGAS